MFARALGLLEYGGVEIGGGAPKEARSATSLFIESLSDPSFNPIDFKYSISLFTSARVLVVAVFVGVPVEGIADVTGGHV
jgi:hypothetical protein